MLSRHNAGFIDIAKKNFFRTVFQQVLFCGKIEIGIRAFRKYTAHFGMSINELFTYRKDSYPGTIISIIQGE